MIKCPECNEVNTIFFEGVVSIPVISERMYEDNEPFVHSWDWDNAEVVDERGYFCSNCEVSDLQPGQFVVQPTEDI